MDVLKKGWWGGPGRVEWGGCVEVMSVCGVEGGVGRGLWGWVGVVSVCIPQHPSTNVIKSCEESTIMSLFQREPRHVFLIMFQQKNMFKQPWAYF